MARRCLTDSSTSATRVGRKRIAVCIGLWLGVLVPTTPSAWAETLSSANYSIEASQLNGGGAVALQNAAPSPSLQVDGFTTGQGMAIGVSSENASSDGSLLESGLWAIAVPEPHTDLLALAAIGTLLCHLRKSRTHDKRGNHGA